MTTDLRRDELTGLWVAYAPARAARPGAAREVEDELASCPFCAGHEDRTPPETLRLGDGPTGWDVRVVPNLFPALERQEVVVHGHEHRRSFGDLGDATIELVAEAWRRRARDTGGHPFAFVNEGHEAGASLPHSHSQLAWLPAPPAERSPRRGEVVLERDGVVARCPDASRAPYEVVVVPRGSERDGLRSELLGAALRLLAELERRLRRVRGERTPFNAWLQAGDPWHLELVPRTTRFAGLELGAGVYVNPVPPDVAAAALRTAGGS